MPYLKPETARLRAAKLVKDCFDNGLNQSALARKEGVSQQAINQRFNKLPVGTPLQAALKKIGITTAYKAKKFKELLESKNKRSLNFKTIEVPDNQTRASVLKLMCQVDKDIDGEKSGGVKIINIIHAYRKTEPKTEDARNP
jgi:transcriptional regulator with XRE-family HTH domain